MQQSHNQRSAERAFSTELEDLDKLTQTVIQAHRDTCEFTRDKVKALYQQATYDSQGWDQSDRPMVKIFLESSQPCYYTKEKIYR